MAKHVVIIASGETERRSLPYLVAHLEADGVHVDDVRIPPANRALDVEMAERVLKAAWYARNREKADPQKFVILVDTDGKAPDEILQPFRENLAARLAGRIPAKLQFAVAQRHLEAWYFADITNLRQCLGGRAPGIDTSKPDKIENPKLQIKHLLGARMCTAVISEEIATRLDPEVIAGRSPSFRDFLEAVRNGDWTARPERTRESLGGAAS